MSKILCPAKINLFLNVLGKKGTMHNLCLINQTIDLYDEIKMIPSDDLEIHIVSEDDIPLDETNSIFKAAKLMKEKFDIPDGFVFKVKKNIPTEAGLGGESTDAAGTMILLNQYYNLGLSTEELSRLGIQIGSDVPYFIHSGFQMVTSIGDQVQTPPFQNPYDSYIIVKPNFGLSTKEMFQKVDSLPLKRVPLTKMPYNDFMNVVPSSIHKIESKIQKMGISEHTLSGSGSSYYIPLKEKNLDLFSKIQKAFPSYQVYLVNNCDGYYMPYDHLLDDSHQKKKTGYPYE